MKYFTKHSLRYELLFVLTALLLCGTKSFAVIKTSNGSGPWSTAGTWSPSGVPTGSDNVIIRSGDVVTVSGLRACNSLQIGDGFTDADAAVQVTGTLNINGNLTLNGTNQNRNFTLDAGNGSVNIYGSVYGATNGTNSIQLNSGIISFGSDVNPDGYTIVYGGAGVINFYGNFTDEHNSITPAADCSVFFGGDFTASATPIDWSGKGTVYFDGTFDITANADVTFNNVEFVSEVRTLNGGEGAITIAGTLTIDEGATFFGNDDITVNGNWINDGGVFSSTAGVTFAGTSAIEIGGATSTTFQNLTINNSDGVTLTAPISVRGALTLTNGIITTDNVNILELTSTATSTLGSATAYVDGPMIKTGNTAFTFPVGNDGRWRRVGVSGMSDANTKITAQYFHASPPDILNMTSELTEVSSEEYWDVNRTVTSDPVKVRLYWEDSPLASLTEDCAPLTVAHYTGGKWQKETSALQSGPSSCLEGNSGSIETDFVSSFSPFGFGGGNGSPLPIKLVSFDAAVKGNVVETKWVTSLEINNDFFTIERSANGSEFSEIGKVDGAGNSTTILNYSFDDVAPLAGTSYYRLKQTDYDGTFAYSNTVVVRRTQTESSVSIYPTPAKDQLNISVKDVSDDVSVNIYDRVGRLVYSSVFPVSGKKTTNNIQLDVSDILATGVYFINITSGEESFKEKLIIQ